MNKFAGVLEGVAGEYGEVLEAAKQETEQSRKTQRGPPESTKNTATEDGVKYSFTPYSEKQKKNWESSRSIVICETEEQIRKFVSDARKGTNIGKKMYLGAIPASLAETIRIETGLNVEGYNCSVAAQEIRKIFKDHGNEQTENLRGQRAVTEHDFVNIPVVIQSPDKITRSDRDYNGRPVINFVKLLEGKVTVTAYVSGKHLDLTIQTMFAGKKIGTLPRRQVNKLLPIRPKRTVVQFLRTVYPNLPKKATGKSRALRWREKRSSLPLFRTATRRMMNIIRGSGARAIL